MSENTLGTTFKSSNTCTVGPSPIADFSYFSKATGQSSSFMLFMVS